MVRKSNVFKLVLLERRTKMNLLVTDFDQKGNVMLFDESGVLTEDNLTAHLKAKQSTFTEVVNVQDKDLQFYLYEPCHIGPKTARHIANKYS